MKSHKRLMQSLADATTPKLSLGRVGFVRNPIWGAMVASAMVMTGAELGKALASSRVTETILNSPPPTPRDGDLWFRGTSVQRYDAETNTWQKYRLPGMHRRGGKWVRR